jgi:hypothetical protein
LSREGQRTIKKKDRQPRGEEACLVKSRKTEVSMIMCISCYGRKKKTLENGESIRIGDGRCRECGGSGEVFINGTLIECLECRGSGKCKICDGTGELPDESSGSEESPG